MKFFLACLLLSAPLLPFAQQNIGVENIRKHIYTLADDSMQGRKTGTEGQRMAARYIAGEFTAANLIPAGNKSNDNPYFQRFCIYEKQRSYAFLSPDTTIPAQRQKASVYVNGEKRSLIFGANDLRNDQHFFYISSSRNFSDSIRQVVLAGKDPLNATYKNSQTVMLDGTELSMAKEYVLQLHKKQQICSFIITIKGNKLDNLLADFPEGRFLVGNENGQKYFFKLGTLSSRKLKVPSEIIDFYSLCNQHPECEIIIAGPTVKNALFPDKNTSAAYFRYSASSAGLWDSTVTENVAAVLEGKSKDLIIVGAHYDHVGKSSRGIFNGADDNASGTSAVIEIAREMSQNATKGKIPDKSILFIAFTAEEEGLIGSEAFLLNYPFSDREMTYMINMDMIGRNDKRNDTLSHYTYCLPFAGKKRKMRKAAESASISTLQKNIIRKPDVVNRILYRFGSDHHGFVRRNIPSMVFFTGLHEDYHKTTDTYEKIWYTNNTAIAKVVCETIYLLSGYKGHD